MAEERKVRVHNKSDKPDNVVAREHEIFEECEAIEKTLRKQGKWVFDTEEYKRRF